MTLPDFEQALCEIKPSVSTVDSDRDKPNIAAAVPLGAMSKVRRAVRNALRRQ